MRVTFIGTGEAYSETRSNVSILLQGEHSLLLDCGHLVPPAFSRRFPDHDFLDAVFISHWHADHLAGLVPLCMRWRQEGRKKTLRVIGPAGLPEKFRQLFELVYPGFYNRLSFPLVFDDAVPGVALEAAGFRLSFAHGQHLTGELALPMIAVRAEHGGSAVCYSGDTTYQPAIAELARGCRLLVHDAYQPSRLDYKNLNAHCSPLGAGRCAREAGAGVLALVHVHRTFSERTWELQAEASSEFMGNVLVPADGEVLEI